MKMNLKKLALENKDKLNLTKKQIRILEYILKSSNWLKSNSQIAEDLGVSRVTVQTVYSILESFYEEENNKS